MNPALKERLEAAGFSFHTCDAEGDGGSPELLGKHWYCWCGPEGEWDVEAGPNCDTLELAVLSAVDALIEYAKSAINPDDPEDAPARRAYAALHAAARALVDAKGRFNSGNAYSALETLVRSMPAKL